ncbi:MAG: hypothetical protein HY556_00545 [Euryarchaeota archaeon]|nr:hypothetical protein [Euryarchaeota archaeon]
MISRFGQALDRAFGVRVGHAIYSRYKAVIVEDLTEPILDRMFHVLQVNLRGGRYAESVGRGIDSSRGQIHAAVTRAMKASPNLSTVSRISGMESLIHTVVDEALTATVATLVSDEINVAIQRSVDQTFEDLRKNVRDPKWKEVGVGLGDVGRAFVKGPA